MHKPATIKRRFSSWLLAAILLWPCTAVAQQNIATLNAAIAAAPCFSVNATGLNTFLGMQGCFSNIFLSYPNIVNHGETGTGNIVYNSGPTLSGPELLGTTTFGRAGVATGLFDIASIGGGTHRFTVPVGGASGTTTWPNGTTDFGATGGTSQVVKQTSAGAAFTVARLACSDLSDAASGCSASSGITALTGDGTATGPGSVAFTLATAQPAVHTWALLQTFTVGATATTGDFVATAGNITACATCYHNFAGRAQVLSSGDGLVSVKNNAASAFGSVLIATAQLQGSSSGALTLTVPAAAGSNTLTFPAGTTNFSATGGTSQVVKQTSSGGAFTVGTVAVSDIASLGTGVATALGVNIGTAGSFVVNGGALGSPSSAGTLPAFTLGGTVSGGGNQINNVIIGTTTPLAGAFTTLTASTSAAIAGCTLGTNVFCLTGSAAISGSLAMTGRVNFTQLNQPTTDGIFATNTNGGTIIFRSNNVNGVGISYNTGLILSRGNTEYISWISGSDVSATATPDAFLYAPAAATLQLGAADAASPVAQTIQFQNGSGSNIAAAATATVIGPLGTGTGTNGDIVFQTGVKTTSGSTAATKTTALTIKGETLTMIVPTSASGVPALGTSSNTGISFRSGFEWVSGGTGQVQFPNGGNNSAVFNQQIGFTSGSTISVGADAFIRRFAAATIQLGDVAGDTTGTSQTLQVQGVTVGGTSNQAGGSLTIASGQGKGNVATNTMDFKVPIEGASGTVLQAYSTIMQLGQLSGSSAIIMRINELSIANSSVVNCSTCKFGWGVSTVTLGQTTTDTDLFRSSAGVVGVGTTATTANGSMLMTGLTATGTTVIFSGIGSDTATTDTTACIKSSDGTLLKGTGTLGICLGTSSGQHKERITALPEVLAKILTLKPKNFFYKKGHGDDGAREQSGFIAEDFVSSFPKLTHLDAGGKPMSVDLLGLVPILAGGMQEQYGLYAALDKRVAGLSASNDNLKAEIALLKKVKP